MNVVSDSESQADDVLLANASPGSRFSKKVVAAVLAGAAVLFAPAAIHLAQPAVLQQSDVESVQIDAEVFTPKLDSCVDTPQNCFSAKCCKTTGFSCFQTGPTAGKCAAACPPGGSCKPLVPFYKQEAAWTAGDRCFAICSTRCNEEPPPSLLITQRSWRSSSTKRRTATESLDAMHTRYSVTRRLTLEGLALPLF